MTATAIHQPQQKTSIPKFKNGEEAAEWFDAHDLADYWHELEPVDVDFQLEKPRDENIVIRVQKPIKDRLDRIARSKGLNLSSLARMWLIEKLQSA